MSSTALLAAHQGCLYTLGMDLRPYFEGKEGVVARHFKITISAVSQWVVKGKVPLLRAVPTARLLELPDETFLPPQSTGGVNHLLTILPKASQSAHQKDGDGRMHQIIKELGKLELRIEQLEQRFEKMVIEVSKLRPPKAGRS